jgi:hypothetical protein
MQVNVHAHTIHDQVGIHGLFADPIYGVARDNSREKKRW